MSTPRTMTRRPVVWRVFRLGVLGIVLAVCATLAPSSSVKPTDLALIKLKQAETVDTTPDVIWLVAVGSDARPGEDMTHTRGDALHLIGINTKSGAAADIGVPRDSWVEIPGVGHNKINAALYYGGPELIAEAVGNLFGIQPDYVFVTRFTFFQNLIRSIGGVDVDNPVAFSDSSLKPKGFPEGHLHLGPWDALAFSRSRHDLLRGDFDRSANQSRVLAGIQASIRSHVSKPGWLEEHVLTAMQNMASNASPGDIYRLAHAVAAIKPSKITQCVLLGGIGDIGGASVVLPYTDMAQRFGDEARDDATLDSCD
ncbi:MAG TPA: LCP family protein [Nocardioides sp.]|uniref:LCP family protein n=1 Tax=Nocardioides sp. TaxID=35761 RepID=UPI002E369151|nr:LCP family protein [Nocardioides sp.]HEX5087501.1 LCP family protein [Nocardioides sp.]